MAVVSHEGPSSSAGSGTVAKSGWQASLGLRFDGASGRTRIVEREHIGPLLVQRPFYPEGSKACHTYVLHPPGGVVGGDVLRFRAEAVNGAHALLTTTAATKLYRSAGPRATLQQELRIDADATIEWLPQEIIAFDGADVEARTDVDLHGTARFIGWDIVALGRPAAGRPFDTGRVVQHLVIQRDGQRLLHERLELEGSGRVLRAPWGLGGHRVTATLVASVPEPVDPPLAGIRNLLDERPGLTSATSMGGLLIVRFLGDTTREAFATLAKVWQLIRPSLLGRPAELPRIWST